MKVIDITGNKYGRLTVIKRTGTKGGQAMWLCECECGKKKEIAGSSLRKGLTKSCGCLFSETRIDISHKSIAKEKHGGSRERLYFVWNDMKRRCNDPRNNSYELYGGRGIKVCNEWVSDYDAFRKWAVNNGYDSSAKRGECTLDRIDVNGNYEPSNCRWRNMKYQSNNRRNSTIIEWNGEKHTLTEWAEILCIDYKTLYYRISSGWDIDKAFSKQ